MTTTYNQWKTKYAKLFYSVVSTENIIYFWQSGN